ncbi:hypothetical protein pb186bvf_014247 [Paramecium bursaria]
MQRGIKGFMKTSFLNWLLINLHCYHTAEIHINVLTIIFTLGQLQQLSLLMVQIIQNVKEMDSYFMHIRKYIGPIIELVLDQRYFRVFTYLTFSIILIEKLIGLFLQTQVQHKNEASDMKNMTNNRFYILKIIRSIYLQIYLDYLFILFQTIVFISLKQSYENFYTQQSFITDFVVSFISFLIIFYDFVIYSLTLNETMLVREGSLQITEVTLGYYLHNLLKTLFIIFFSFLNSRLSININCIIIIIQCLIELRDYIVNQIHINKVRIKICLFINSGYLSFSTTYFILDIFNLHNSNLPIISILIQLIVYQLLLNQYERYHQLQLMIFLNQKEDLSKLSQDTFMIASSYRNILIANYEDQIKERQLVHTFISIQAHQQQCLVKPCSCLTQTYQDQLQIKIVIKNQNAQNFIFKKIQQLISIQRQYTKINKTNYINMYFQQVSLLLQYGWPIIAIEMLNQFKDGGSRKLSSLSSRNFNEKQRDSGNRENSKSHSESKVSYLNSVENDFRFQYKLDQFDMSKYLFLIEQCKKKLSLQFQVKELKDSSKEFSANINYFLSVEQQCLKVEQQIQQLLKRKIMVLQNLQTDQQLDHNTLFSMLDSLNGYEIKTENIVMQYLQTNSTYRAQSIASFFFGEVQNNVMKTMEVRNQTVIADERQAFIQNKQMHQALYYLILQLNDDMSNFTIIQKSGNFDHKYSHVQTFNQILPLGVRQDHELFVQRFLNKGKSKFFRKFDLSFLIDEKGFIVPIQLSFDHTQIIKSNNMMFATFLQESTPVSCIIVDINRHIGGLTKQALQWLGVDDKNLIKMIKLHNEHRVDIIQLIPNFVEISDNQTQDNIDIIYFNSNAIQNIEAFMHKSQNTKGALSKILNERGLTRSYKAQISIQTQEIYGYNYYFVYIDSIITEQEKFLYTITDTNRMIDFNISEIALSEVEAYPKQIKSITPRPFSSYRDELIKSKSQQIIQSPTREEIQYDQNIIALISPNQSQSQFVNKHDVSYQKFLTNEIRQQFFNEAVQQEQSSDQIYSKQRQYEMQDNDVAELASQASQKTGVRYSQYQKKYESFSSVMNLKNSVILQLQVFFQVLQQVVITIFLVISIAIMTNDIQSFLKDLELMQLHANFMAPHDLFLVMKQIIAIYQQYEQYGLMTQDQYVLYTKNFSDNLPFGYDQLKTNFYAQLENPYLVGFLLDKYVNVTFSKSGLTTYKLNMTFQEQLLIDLQYQHQYLVNAIINRTDDLAIQTYTYGNYFKLHQSLDQITSEILSVSKDNSDIISLKWLKIWIIFLLFCCIFSLINYYLNHKFYEEIDQILEINNFLNTETVQEEHERYKQLLKIISSDRQTLYRYIFDLQLKEQVVKVDKKQLTNNSRQYDKLNKGLKLSRLIFVIIQFFICIIFIAISTYLQQSTEQFLTKYKQTADIFVFVQDLRFKSGNIYLYGFYIQYASQILFLDSADLVILDGLYNSSLVVMQQYLLLAGRIDTSQNLVNQDFIDYLNQVHHENLCKYLDSQLQFLTGYCALSFGGVLQNGLLQSLTYIINDQKNSMIEFQTKKVVSTISFFSLEGSQVVTWIFFSISDKLKQGIIDINNLWVYLIKIISGLYIGYAILISSYFIYFRQKRMVTIFERAKRIITLVPLKVLLTNDSYERALRFISMRKTYL